MRRGILAVLTTALMVGSLAAPTAAAENEVTCRSFSGGISVCVWLLEPNPSGGNLYHVRICHGRACFDIAQPTADSATAQADKEICRRFGAEWYVCVWLLEPNPGGGNLFYVRICEGATCVYLSEPDPR
jgi:hypothetical protein